MGPLKGNVRVPGNGAAADVGRYCRPCALGRIKVCHPRRATWYLADARAPARLGALAGHRRAFGATSRVPDQFRPALTVEVCDSPAVGAASPISLGST
jgi:hypothetical protein